ncbi:MAG: endonuclease/exonuclease/phosphatase family protein [Candidatus Rokubacteria bacterium]|nr:endonuclease/exonuclease/phosphatase family protein [Candidatus Rokubacteria bacterium]
MRALTVVSYNIHRARGLDQRVDVDRIAQVLSETGADVVGLQEVFASQAASVARELGMEVAMGPTRSWSFGHYGNAVLSRLAVRSQHRFDLTCPGREPRGGLRVDLDAGATLLHLFNVHFGLTFRERRQQVELLLARQITHPRLEGPRVLMGDFNEWLPGPVVRRLRREFGVRRRRARRTHPAPFPLFPLDQIFWDAGLVGEQLRVHRSRLARVASDHLPVVARLRLGSEGGSAPLPIPPP